jgi:hypothetical protein
MEEINGAKSVRIRATAQAMTRGYIADWVTRQQSIMRSFVGLMARRNHSDHSKQTVFTNCGKEPEASRRCQVIS